MGVSSDGGVAEMGLSFGKDGVCIKRAFVDQATLERMDRAVQSLVHTATTQAAAAAAVFRTDEQQEAAQGGDEYFLGSADKTRFFLEPRAMDDANRLRDDVPRPQALNKIGHALHVDVPAFRDYACSERVRALLAELGYVDPRLPQSMLIFKQPRIGGEVTPHQDSTFLRTEPLSCVGLWLALHDATTENGCLWVRPGSHTEPLRRHFRREHDPSMTAGVRMVFDQLVAPDASTPATAMEGKPVGDPSDLGFVAVPAQRGDLIVIHGQVDHMSLPNTSPHPRHTFQLHFVEGSGTTWHSGNWLQYPDGRPFPSFDTLRELSDREEPSMSSGS